MGRASSPLNKEVSPHHSFHIKLKTAKTPIKNASSEVSACRTASILRIISLGELPWGSCVEGDKAETLLGNDSGLHA
jgi:hypothetical protein